jgi:predicted P-loop ATPase
VPEWQSTVIRNESGNPKAILYNAILALGQDPTFAGAIKYDAFRTQTMLCAPVPWDQNVVSPRPWTDQDDREATSWLQDAQVVVGELVTGSAVQTVAERNRYHPVMDYLGSLSWDGVLRLDKWLVRYIGAEDTEYVCAVGPRWMISAVARIEEPKCQADCVLVLEGPQGIRKTTTFNVLGGAYYSNDIAALGTTAAQEQILGKWIIELDELDAVTRASDIAAVRAFVSRREDHFRLPYARRSISHPRQCVFGGTTNRETWLRDETGGRRWWPVRCGEIDIDALREDRDQLWAEARDRYYTGEPYWLEVPRLVALASEEQEKRYEVDPWEELVRQRKGDLPNLVSQGAGVNEIFAVLNIPVDRRGALETKRVGNLLRHMGWERRLTGASWRYFPK